MPSKDSLKAYRGKRDLRKTPEPSGERRRRGGQPRFVIQKHDASSLGEEVAVEDAVGEGHVKVWLEGQKVKGGYALTRTGGGKDERWLLVKMDDEEADARRNPVSSEPGSATTGRSLDQIAEEDGQGTG